MATCFQIAHKSQRFHRLPDEIKLHGQSSRVKNLQQIYEFALPSFLPSYFEFFKKKRKEFIQKLSRVEVSNLPFFPSFLLRIFQKKKKKDEKYLSDIWKIYPKIVEVVIITRGNGRNKIYPPI